MNCTLRVKSGLLAGHYTNSLAINPPNALIVLKGLISVALGNTLPSKTKRLFTFFMAKLLSNTTLYVKPPNRW